MTFCLGMKVNDGIVGIADTRITAGNACLTAKKINVYEHPGEKKTLFMMTSGLRALRDKAITYFHEMMDEEKTEFRRLYEVVNAFGAQVRRVAAEDKKSLIESGFQFDLYALFGGQLKDDAEHRLFMLFPEGNWVEVGQSSPYFIIGNTAHGKALLDRALHYDSGLEYALKVGFLSFNATQISANDVDYPIDIVCYRKNSFHMIRHRFSRADLQQYSNWWQDKIIKSIHDLPNDWVKTVFEREGLDTFLKNLEKDGASYDDIKN